MKSSSGAHFIALDHIRALAAFFVFAWHFIHGANGYPVPFEFVPAIIPFALPDEGHCGVALFMTLSGYLFAKLLDGKAIFYRAFFWNRALRLLPLLALVIVIVGVQDRMQGGSALLYVHGILNGLLHPTLPNGGWSITVEFHFYLLLPLLLLMMRTSRWLSISALAVAIVLRAGLFLYYGEIQSLSYWTLIGRIDQFILGMLAFQYRHVFAGRHFLAGTIMVLFTLFYWLFDIAGGFYLFPVYPSPSALWIFLPTIEGLAFAPAIAWYDGSFSFRTMGVSKFIGQLGAYSYSIYLLHFFLVFKAASFIDQHVMRLSNFYVALSWATFCFILMMPIGYLSYRWVEAPFLRLRKRYIRPRATENLIAPIVASGIKL